MADKYLKLVHFFGEMDLNLNNNADEIYKKAVINSCNTIIVTHNHPSGDPAPSEEDKRVTKTLFKAGEILGIKLLDHVIIGKTTYSFTDNMGGLK